MSFIWCASIFEELERFPYLLLVFRKIQYFYISEMSYVALIDNSVERNASLVPPEEGVALCTSTADSVIYN